MFNLIFINNLIKHNCNVSLRQKQHTRVTIFYKFPNPDKLDLELQLVCASELSLKYLFSLSHELILNEQIFDVATVCSFKFPRTERKIKLNRMLERFLIELLIYIAGVALLNLSS